MKIYSVDKEVVFKLNSFKWYVDAEFWDKELLDEAIVKGFDPESWFKRGKGSIVVGNADKERVVLPDFDALKNFLR